VPIYDYVCSACGHRFEVLRGLNEAGPGQCPLCEGPVVRAFAPPTIVFKGSGWAKVDRRNSGAPTTRGSSGEQAGETAAGEAAEAGQGAAEKAGEAAGGGASTNASPAPTAGPSD